MSNSIQMHLRPASSANGATRIASAFALSCSRFYITWPPALA